MVQWLLKTVWQFIKKLNTELPDDPATVLLGVFSKELKAGAQTGICTSSFIAKLFTIAKRWKQPKMSTGG